MWKWAGRILGFICLAFVAALIGIVIWFQAWRSDLESDLVKNSTIAETARGPIEYAEIGEGPAVLISHGTPGGYDDPYSYLKITHAEQNGFRYIVPSRPGYLRTPLSVGATPADQADAFAALLDKLGIQKAALIAQSGGGPSALQFALRHPDRCSALVLESALIRNYAGPAPNVPKGAFGLWLRDLTIFAVRNIGLPIYRAMHPMDAEVAALSRAALQSVVPYRLRKAGVENDLVQETRLDGWPLDRITCPTLILQGTADTSVPLADAEYAHQQIPGSQLVELAGQDHMMIYVKHEEIDRMIIDFLKKHP